MSEKKRAREDAYKTWVGCGQNFSEAERQLKREGLPVSRQTLTAWAERYDWKGRAARSEAEKQKEETAVSEAALVHALERQKQRYEVYFDAMQPGIVDNQACYAFCGLVKTIIAVRREAGNGKQEGKSAEQDLIVRNDEERVAAIEKMVDVQIGRILADPEKVNAGAFREIRGALDTIDRIREKMREPSLDTAAEAEGKSEEIEAMMREIATPEDAKAALWEVFSRMINSMLAHPQRLKVAEIERAQQYLSKMMSLETQAERIDTGTERKAAIERIEEAAILADVGLWTEDEAVGALQDFVRRQLSVMREDRGAARVGQVKAVRDAMELIDEMKARSAKQEAGSAEKKKGLSKEMAREIREKILKGDEA